MNVNSDPNDFSSMYFELYSVLHLTELSRYLSKNSWSSSANELCRLAIMGIDD